MEEHSFRRWEKKKAEEETNRVMEEARIVTRESPLVH
jgi:hypothetical protein